MSHFLKKAQDETATDQYHTIYSFNETLGVSHTTIHTTLMKHLHV